MNGVRDISMKALTDPLPGKSVVPFHFAARSAARPCGNGVALSIEQWTSEVRTVWEQGGTNTLELARVVCAARRGLRYGQWSQLWKSGKMPFSRRKGAMLVVIGQRLGGIDAQTFAHLPLEHFAVARKCLCLSAPWTSPEIHCPFRFSSVPNSVPTHQLKSSMKTKRISPILVVACLVVLVTGMTPQVAQSLTIR